MARLEVLSMQEDNIHFVTKWEVTIIELENHVGKKYKVTRRLPDMSVSETKVFGSKEEAKKQFEDWLN